MKLWKRWLAVCLAVLLMAGTMPATGFMAAHASDVEIKIDKIPHGKTGKKLTISFKIINLNDDPLEDVSVGFDVSGGEIWDEEDEDREYGYSFPFEVTESLPTSELGNSKHVGTIDKEKTVSLSGTIRRDLSNNYYKVPIVVLDSAGSQIGWADLKVWITQSSGSSSEDDEDETKTYDFVLGENQSTPDGIYPNVLNFSLNLRNNSPAAVYNIKASMTMDADTDKFPFEINDANYDRMFEKIEVDETVQLVYSFAIRKDAYSGYYPIPMKIYYSKSSTGDELQTYETSFFVRVHNKEKEDEYGDFNEHDREKARLIVDSFTTQPARIIAGEDFDLVLKMKNASNSIGATNILFSMESEKVSDSAVFTTESGSSSVALDSLGPGAVSEIRLRLKSKPSVDQRSYGLTIKAKYDSPEFKNAEENMVIDIPVHQVARLNTGTFEVMPDSIFVGEEANVMFSINNTGRVLLYNVMVSFEAASIQATDTYVGNIKPGESGNVDCMLAGTAPTTDDGKVKVTISFEDENGTVATEEKELTLFVMEDLGSVEDMEPMDDEPMDGGEETGQNRHRTLAAVCGAAVLLAAAAIIITKRRKRRLTAAEDDDDEIS